MKETELIKLFATIQNTYSGFAFDRFKIQLWLDLLKNVPFELAQNNLRRYLMDPENKFPPHPGVLAATPTANAGGPAIPDAAETRMMLDELDRLALLPPAPIPEHFREAVKRLGEPSNSRSQGTQAT